MASYTEHYQLHQWVPEDDFLRTDFNEDFAKIDAALGGQAGNCHRQLHRLRGVQDDHTGL